MNFLHTLCSLSAKFGSCKGRIKTWNVVGEKAGHFPVPLPDPMILFILGSSAGYSTNFPPKERSFGCNIQVYVYVNCHTGFQMPTLIQDTMSHCWQMRNIHTKSPLKVKGELTFFLEAHILTHCGLMVHSRDLEGKEKLKIEVTIHLKLNRTLIQCFQIKVALGGSK